MKSSNKTQMIKALISNNGSKHMSVTFIKKSDGTERTIGFNPREGVKLVSGERAKATATRKANNPDLINVVDSGIANREEDRRNGWRSFRCDTVIRMSIGGEVIEFKE